MLLFILINLKMIICRKLYSSVKIEQKEYGLKDLGKNIKKLKDRLSISKQLEKRSAKLGEDLEEFGKKVKPDKKLARNLAREAYRNNTRVFDENKFFRGMNNKISGDISIPVSPEENKEYRDILKTYGDFMHGNKKKVIGAIASKRHIINLSRKFDERPDILAHELGHKLNEKSPKTKEIRELHKKAQNKLNKILDKENKEGGLRLKDQISKIYNTGKERRYQPKEEMNAWKNGIELMRRNGASEEELGLTKEIAKKAVDKYKVDNNRELYKSFKWKRGKKNDKDKK